MHKSANYNIGRHDKSEKTSIFLWISLCFFALSLLVFFVKIVLLYYEFKTTSSILSLDDFIRFKYNFVIELFAYIMFILPALLLGLSSTRSVYRILKYNPHSVSRTCLLISANLSFSAFVFQALMFASVLYFTQNSSSIKLQKQFFADRLASYNSIWGEVSTIKRRIIDFSPMPHNLRRQKTASVQEN